FFLFVSCSPRPPRSSFFPYTTLFRSESFLIGVERCDRNDRTEDFFLEDACIWGNIGEDGWLQEVSFWEFFRTVTTGYQACFFFTDLHVGPDLVEVLWVDQGTDFGFRIAWQTNFDVGGLGCVALDEFVIDAALNQDA